MQDVQKNEVLHFFTCSPRWQIKNMDQNDVTQKYQYRKAVLFSHPCELHPCSIFIYFLCVCARVHVCASLLLCMLLFLHQCLFSLQWMSSSLQNYPVACAQTVQIAFIPLSMCVSVCTAGICMHMCACMCVCLCVHLWGGAGPSADEFDGLFESSCCEMWVLMHPKSGCHVLFDLH